MDELPSVTKLKAVAAKMTNNVMSLSMADVECLDQAAALIRALVAAGNQASIALSYATGDLDNPMIVMAAKAHGEVAKTELDAALAKAREA